MWLTIDVISIPVYSICFVHMFIRTGYFTSINFFNVELQYQKKKKKSIFSFIGKNVYFINF